MQPKLQSASTPNELIIKGEYDEAIVLLRKNLKLLPYCHWSWSELSSAYYEKKQYKLALRYAKKALSLNPNCPSAMWHYAGACSASRRCQDAYHVYKTLLNIGVSGLDKMENCNEGHIFNIGFINDCRLNIGICAYELKHYKEAKNWINLFVKNYSKNCIHSIKFASRLLVKIEKG